MEQQRQKELLEALKKHFGFDRFKGNQQAIIENVLSGKDTFVLMPTGGGKSLCYQLPAMLLEGTAVVISPLIALMKNQVDAVRGFAGDDGVAHFLNSSLSRARLEEVKRDVRSGRTKLLYVAPESLNKADNMDFLREVPISFYAVDEAHCISEWGHDFRPEYRRIRSIVSDINLRPIIALTATATPKVGHDILKNLGIEDATVFKSSFNRPNLYYQIKPKTEDIDRDIVKFILSHPKKSGIVYCMSRNKVTTFAQVLQANGIRARAYHAGLDAKERSDNQDAFLNEEIEVIVATIAFGMGIDKPDVRYVIHYDMPKSLEGYYQETGRAGRDGGEGNCIAYYCREDLDKLEKLMKGKPVSDQEIAKQLLEETADYAESHLCRRVLLLNYFGEKYQNDNCHCCDNCLTPKNKVEAQELLLNLLEVIGTLKEKFNTDYVIRILRGEVNSDVESFHHEDLDGFGIGQEHDESMWNTVIRQALVSGYIEKDVETYGLLKITAAGKKYMKKPVSFKVVVDVDSEGDEEDFEGKQAGGAGGAVDPVLFSIMKDLRKKMGQLNKVPPYVIFQDASLEAMATFYPITMDELQNIPGVGAGKAQRYGQQFLDIIRKHVEDNDIDRPEDLRVRTLPNKSKMKVQIIQQIDRKVALDDIAISHGLEFDQLLSEIEAIVYSGTRINISYFIDEIMDEDHMLDIYDYFKESTTDNLEAAMDELGGDYTEEEIRLVRIRFISEMAN
ncbi:DNA helicase RecQ [Porphyromonas sp. COT-239 OH1446]|uniref:DNA helicase RecQ n=1 Tax=Porphyromonas sp. COT-239 OH1446 TaxID=1515613 RepID=UPI00052CBCE7|nr:DNA helicase RecQ [Porphyromonas sp. COT-239 OH1446]KGN71338.1 ATP-dependent DNA helicase RecQ [Porphyromonas sp. COT-239 OH1446]